MRFAAHFASIETSLSSFGRSDCYRVFKAARTRSADQPWKRLAAIAYGASIAEAMIAKVLAPENLTAILNKARSIRPALPIVNMRRLIGIDPFAIFETLMRISPVKPTEFLIRFGVTESAGGVSIHFEGNGWKLLGIQLPAAAVQVLAQDLINRKGRNGEDVRGGFIRALATRSRLVATQSMIRLQQRLNFGCRPVNGGRVAAFGDDDRYLPVGRRRRMPRLFQNHDRADAFASRVLANFPEHDFDQLALGQSH
jgi:hypothetical protein